MSKNFTDFTSTTNANILAGAQFVGYDPGTSTEIRATISNMLSAEASSAKWNTAYTLATGLTALSSNWQNTYTTTNANSANWTTAYTLATGLTSLSSNWQNTYTTVSSNSAKWNTAYTLATGLTSLSSNWQNTYTTTSANSAKWNTAYTLATGLTSLSSNWQNTYTTVSSNSANWNTAYTLATGLSASLSSYMDSQNFVSTFPIGAVAGSYTSSGGNGQVLTLPVHGWGSFLFYPSSAVNAYLKVGLLPIIPAFAPQGYIFWTERRHRIFFTINPNIYDENGCVRIFAGMIGSPSSGVPPAADADPLGSLSAGFGVEFSNTSSALSTARVRLFANRGNGPLSAGFGASTYSTVCCVQPRDYPTYQYEFNDNYIVELFNGTVKLYRGLGVYGEIGVTRPTTEILSMTGGPVFPVASYPDAGISGGYSVPVWVGLTTSTKAGLALTSPNGCKFSFVRGYYEEY